MADAGITTGTSPTTFAPDETLTRAQAATFLHRLAGEPAAPAHNFIDVVSGWQQDGVSWMSHTGITTGTSPTTFAPDETLTHAQLVTFLYRYQNEPDVTINPTTPACQTQTEAGGFKTVSTGTGHNCGVRVDDTITCWGWNEYGQADAPDGGFKAVVAGSFHSCGIRVDDTITCWGYNRHGQADAPTGAFKAVVARGWYSYGIRVDDSIACWGYNGDRQADPPEGEFKTLSAASYHSCGIRVDDTIACWGARLNDSGQTDAPAGAFNTVSAGRSHSCGIRVDDTITCWGHIWDGRRLVPADSPDGEFKTVSAGIDHSCGIRVDDTITCWGSNRYGQVDAPAGAFITVSAGSGHSCGIRVDTITCWGRNSHGQGDASTNEPTTTPTPTTVPRPTVRPETTARIPAEATTTYTLPHGGLSPDALPITYGASGPFRLEPGMRLVTDLAWVDGAWIIGIVFFNDSSIVMYVCIESVGSPTNAVGAWRLARTDTENEYLVLYVINNADGRRTAGVTVRRTPEAWEERLSYYPNSPLHDFDVSECW